MTTLNLGVLVDQAGYIELIGDGGDDARRRAVRWARVLDAPDDAPQLLGGELVVVALDGAAADETVGRLITALITEQAAAILFAGTTAEALGRATAGLSESQREAIAMGVIRPPGSADEVMAMCRDLLEVPADVAPPDVADGRPSHTETGLAPLEILRRSASVSGGPAALLTHDDVVVAHSDEWDAAMIAEAVRVPLRVFGSAVGSLALNAPTPDGVTPARDRLIMDLIALNARRVAIQEIAGEILDDVSRYRLSDVEGEQRLAALGFWSSDPPSSERSVLIARAPGAANLLRTIPYGFSELLGGGDFRSAIAQDNLVWIVNGQADIDAGTHLQAALKPLKLKFSIGIGSAHTGVAGLRLSWHEAVEATAAGPGVHAGRNLSLVSLTLQRGGDQVRRLSQQILEPLRSDEARSGDLLRTLVVFLQSGCSPSLASEALFIHRNTLRYRLSRIEEATGRDMSFFSDQVTLWLALAATGEVDPSEPLDDSRWKMPGG